MNDRRRICIVTGTRAEYGLLVGLMREIQKDPDLILQVIATGMHLSPEFGLTYRQIELDDFTIDAKVEMLLSSDSPVGITKSMGLGVMGFADQLDWLKPDVMVVLGDRFEILAAVQAALIARVPVAHIHGGETTEGAFDEGIRHAITKMSHWHFVAAEAYRRRVVQMGEPPHRVFNFGSPGLDQIAELDWLDRNVLRATLNLPECEQLFLVTYHPVTLDQRSPEQAMQQLLCALESFPEAGVVFTYPNADTGGRALIEAIDRFVSLHPKRARAFASLGSRRYLSLMRYADVVIGNSSSGLIETPFLKTATVNVGDRQKGRLKASSVIDASETAGDIASAIGLALSPGFRLTLGNTVSLYGHGRTGPRIKTVLKTAELSVRKPFFDIPHEY